MRLEKLDNQVYTFGCLGGVLSFVAENASVNVRHFEHGLGAHITLRKSPNAVYVVTLHGNEVYRGQDFKAARSIHKALWKSDKLVLLTRKLSRLHYQIYQTERAIAELKGGQ